jgi:hypothetical protein
MNKDFNTKKLFAYSNILYLKAEKSIAIWKVHNKDKSREKDISRCKEESNRYKVITL